MKTGFLPQHGGFRKLRSFQTAQLAYDGTVIFCDRFIDKRSRTHDQMVQAARSGVQNIAEGSLASATSKETELKLTNVARASLGELLLDYEDFLRQRSLRQWTMDSPKALEVRKLYLSDRSDLSDNSKAPSCPKCGKPMRQRVARTGSHAGESFWGCTGYPECREIKNYQESTP